MNRRTVAVLAALATVLAVAGAASPVTAAAQSVPRAVALLDEDRATDAGGNGPVACNGGAQEQSFTVSDNAPLTLAETGMMFQPLPGAAITVTTPAADNDQLLVLFTAEGRVQGQPVTYAAPLDFLQIQILIDGVPVGANDLTFTSGAGESGATQACKRVAAPVFAPAPHVVEVQWRLVDQAGASMLTGILDDWTLSVQVSA
ncbi:hypothetical protein CS0771_44400 [Catellatospora sp. IY07-71]|uniref:hypothetical protein n=1 Tax=Catellatospora sp. IY07-71 TaxID=2728827 RepID=UPI001BB3B521|nr:hypothetical protein [Catellatospora sp. IY07-71]BCJ74896.1 hypothetical protein CS0771_44400 [Catellatospora sp. IY07-71]